ncbi:MAG: efflux RND transporter periplasmic adaptor subunit [Clostridia bacterium]|nr:efflux RND transporter periplasmic adaptor subunit [Clostridia bacterium]
MSRINKLLSIVLTLLCLLSASASDYLIDVNEIQYETAANYETTEVKKATFEKIQNSGAQTYYPLEYAVKYEGANAQFVDFHVKRNDEIKVGDLIATFSIQRDEVEITRRNMAIQKNEENYRRGLTDYEDRLRLKDEEIALSQNAYEREIKQLEKEKILIEREKYIYETENALDDQKKSLDELLKTYENTNLYSEVNGIVSEIAYFRDLQWIYSDTQLMKVYDPSVVLYRVGDDQGKMRYNMEVMLSVGRAENRVMGAGRVVACPMAKPGGTGDSYAYVRVDEFTGPVKTQTSPMVTYYAQYLENVFVVDRNAITTYSGRNFVYKLSEDGMVSKRYVGFALGSQQTGAILIDGVTEGEKLIIDR